MKYLVYKIINNINGKIYIGCHKTNNVDDGYMGSGKYLKHSLEKYGLENFTKEILFIFDSSEEMYNKEAELVTKEFLAKENTYNLKIGGFGGFDHLNKNYDVMTERNKKASILAKEVLKKLNNDTSSNWYKQRSKKRAKNAKRLYEEGKSGLKTDGFKGKSHSKSTKEKIGKASSANQSGRGNSQYGTRWIHNLELKKSKRIKKDEQLPEGWLEGRKIKF